MADFERDSGWLSGSVVDAEDARLATGVLAAASSDPGNPIASRTGLKPGPGSPGNVEATDTPSRFVTVRPFQAVIQGTRTTAAGPYLATLAQKKTLDVLGEAPAHTSNPRLALVIAQQTDRQYGDPGDGMVVRVVAGDPAESPVRPRVDGDHVPLAEIRIPPRAAVITKDDIRADLRVSTVAAGGVLPLQLTESLPADGYDGQRLYDLKNDLDMVRKGTSWRPAVTGQIQFFGPFDTGWPRVGTTETTAFTFNQVTVTPASYPRMLVCTGQLTATAASGEARFDHVIRAAGESGNMSVSAFTCGPTLITTTVATANRLMPAGTAPLVITQQFVRVAGTGILNYHAGFSNSVYSGLRVIAFPVPSAGASPR